MDKATLREEILSHISLPVIHGREVSAAAYGIYPDSGENLRYALQAAIDDLSAGGGGRLCLPAGTYRSGSLRLKSGVELHLESPETCIRFVNTGLEEMGIIQMYELIYYLHKTGKYNSKELRTLYKYQYYSNQK